MGNPVVIGLTGGIGSGKSTVAKMFGELGVHWVDADIVAREVVEPGTPALAEITGHFGEAVVQPDGSLDRAALRTIVFQDANEREWLESLLHPTIRDELARQLQPRHYNLPYVLLVSPLLLETDQHTLVHKAIVVDVPEETQIERTMSRDSNDREQVERIIAAQMPRKHRLERGDFVIRNDRPLDLVRAEVEALHQQLLDLTRG